MDISVVICTYNRSEKLVSALEHLGRLMIPSSTTWEIIVVDNRSTDDTARAISDVASRSGLPIRYVYEARPGLGAARNAGIAASRADIIAFSDDDVFPATDWITTILDEFRQDPQLAGLGGRVQLHNPLDYPITIRTRTDRYRLSGPAALMTGIPGCNMAFRREDLLALGGFDADFGAGGPLVSAEDTEFLFRALKRGLKLVYCPAVLVSHDHGRRTSAQLDALVKSYLVGRGAMYGKHILCLDGAMLRLAYWELRGNIREALADVRQLRTPRASFRRTLFLFLGAMLVARMRLARAAGGLARTATRRCSRSGRSGGAVPSP